MVEGDSDVLEVPKGLLIGGQWSAPVDGGSLELENPATEEQIGVLAKAGATDLELAAQAAEDAFHLWRRSDPWERTAVLRRAATNLRSRKAPIAALLTEEQGKPLREAYGELETAANYLDWYADEARRQYGRVLPSADPATHLTVLRQPIGPVAAFVPWNFPVVLAARKVGAALAAGCSVVLKPAEEAPRAVFCLARCLEDAGLPPGVLNVVTGVPDEISRFLIGHDAIRKVSFTGSVPVGKHLMKLAAEGMKPVSLELGGHAPVIVFDDADVDLAVRSCVQGKFRNSGQVCIAPSRIYLARGVAELFTNAFIERVRELRLGDGFDAATDVGPLASRRRLEGVSAFVADAVGTGAEVRTGGKRPADRERGYFYEPSVLTSVSEDAVLMSEEVFGPIAVLAEFDEPDEAIAMANHSSYGLAAYAFTGGLKHAQLASSELEVGLLGLNTMQVTRPDAPFGGVKASGIGREGGTEGVESYTTTKFINQVAESG